VLPFCYHAAEKQVRDGIAGRRNLLALNSSFRSNDGAGYRRRKMLNHRVRICPGQNLRAIADHLRWPAERRIARHPFEDEEPSTEPKRFPALVQ
jgi:hypothetical protein